MVTITICRSFGEFCHIPPGCNIERPASLSGNWAGVQPLGTICSHQYIRSKAIPDGNGCPLHYTSRRDMSQFGSLNLSDPWRWRQKTSISNSPRPFQMSDRPFLKLKGWEWRSVMPFFSSGRSGSAIWRRVKLCMNTLCIWKLQWWLICHTKPYHSICISHDLLVPARSITYLHFMITKELTL